MNNFKEEIHQKCNELIDREKKRKRFQDLLNISSTLFVFFIIYLSAVSAMKGDFTSIVLLGLAYISHYVVIHYIQLLSDKIYFKPFFSIFVDGFVRIYVMESVKVQRLPIRDIIKSYGDDYKTVPVDRHILDLYRKKYEGDVESNHELMLRFIGDDKELLSDFKGYVNSEAKARRSANQEE